MAATAQGYHDAFLLDFILPQMQSVLDRSSRIYHLLTKTSDGIVTTEKGDYIVSKTRLTAEQGVGSRGMDEQLPDAKEGKFLDAKARLKYHYAQMDIRGQEKILSQEGGPKSRTAIRSILTDKAESLSGTLVKDKNRQIWGKGDGTMARTTAAGAATTTIPVSNPWVFEINMNLDIHAASIQEDRTITAIDYVAKEITVDSNTTFEDDVAISRAGAKDNEMSGFRLAYLPTSLTDWSVWGEYENIDRDTHQVWRPFFLENGGTPRDLDLDLLDEFVFELQERQNDPTKKQNIILIMNSVLFRAIIKLKRAFNQNNEYLDFRLGYKTPVYETPDGPIHLFMSGKDQKYNDWANIILGLSLSDASIRRPFDMTWQFGAGGTILRVVEGYDKERATLVDYEEYYDMAPFRSGVLADVRFPTG